MVSPDRPKFMVIPGGNKPEDLPYLETPAARFLREDKKRRELEDKSGSPDALRDIRKMNNLRVRKRPGDFLSAIRLIQGFDPQDDEDNDKGPAA